MLRNGVPFVTMVAIVVIHGPGRVAHAQMEQGRSVPGHASSARAASEHRGARPVSDGPTAPRRGGAHVPGILERLVPAAPTTWAGLQPILDRLRPNESSTGEELPRIVEPARPPAPIPSTNQKSGRGGPSLVESLRRLESVLHRHHVVERLVPKGPTPPPSPSTSTLPPSSQELVDLLRDLDRQLKRHRVVERVVPKPPEDEKGKDLVGALRNLETKVHRYVLPALRTIERTMKPTIQR